MARTKAPTPTQIDEMLDAAQKLREKGKSVYVATTPPQESALKTYVFREGELEEKK